MVDLDTFLTILYVMVDDFCKTVLPPEVPRPGPITSLSRSEVVTLALCGQWQAFGSERGFYRYGQRHWSGAFPTLPMRTQFNRLMRHHQGALGSGVLYLGQLLQAQQGAYEALDTLAVPTRAAKRRGLGWLPGLADIGWSTRLGWYEGFHLLLAMTPLGVITGFGFGAGRTKDQPLAETLFAVRHTPDPALPSVGAAARGPYLAATGFEGQALHQHWRQRSGAVVICPPSTPVRSRGHGAGAAGSPGFDKSSKRPMALSCTCFASSVNVRMRSMASKPGWPLKSRCIIFVFG